MSTTLLLAAAAVAVAAASESDAPSWGGPDVVTGKGPLPGSTVPTIPGTTVPLVPAIAVTMAATQLHNNATGALNVLPGAITILRTHVATLVRGRHFKLRARAYRWNADKYGGGIQACRTQQWEVEWNLAADTVQMEPEPWGGLGSQECVVVPGIGNYGWSPSWSLEREGPELWLRLTTTNTFEVPATYDMQSWASGGGDFP